MLSAAEMYIGIKIGIIFLLTSSMVILKSLLKKVELSIKFKYFLILRISLMVCCIFRKIRLCTEISSRLIFFWRMAGLLWRILVLQSILSIFFMMRYSAWAAAGIALILYWKKFKIKRRNRKFFRASWEIWFKKKWVKLVWLKFEIITAIMLI